MTQSNPGFQGASQGNTQPLTAVQLNNAFSGKVDETGGALTNPTITGGTLNGITIAGVVKSANNLSDLVSPSAARTNLGLGALATLGLSAVLQPGNNLSEIASAAAARANLGLHGAATQDVPDGPLIGVGGVLTPLTLGTNLSLTGTTLNATGGGSGGVAPPNAQVLGGTGTAFTTLSLGAGLKITGSQLLPDLAVVAPLAAPAFTGGVQVSTGSLWNIGQTITVDNTVLPTAAGTLLLHQCVWNGPTSTNGHQLSPFYFQVNDGVADTATNGLLAGLSIRHTVTSTAAGGRNAILGRMYINGPTANGISAMGQYSAGTFIASTGASDNGTASGSPSTYNGGLFGGNSQVIFSAGATGWSSCNGHEIDVAMAAGSSAAEKVGLRIVLTGANAVRGDFNDAALQFGQQSASSSSWLNLIQIGSPTHAAPTGTDTTLINAVPKSIGGNVPVLAGAGVDLSQVTFTAGGAAFKSPNYVLDGNSGIARQQGFTQPLILGMSGTAASTTSATEVNLASVKVPGGLPTANSAIRVITQWSCTASANAKSFGVRLGTAGGGIAGTLFTNVSPSSSQAGATIQTIIRNAGSLSSQVGGAVTSTGTGFTTGAGTTATINTAADSYINITGIVAGGETLTLLGYTVELINP